MSEFSNLLRGVVIGGLGMIPEVGALVSSIVDAMWPDGSGENGELDNLQSFVNAIAGDLIDQSKMLTLKDYLKGLKENLKNYVTDAASKDSNASGDLTYLVDTCIGYNQTFYGTGIPQETMTYFVTFGTLFLTVLRDRYLMDKTDTSLQLLQKHVTSLSSQAQKLKADTLKWRHSLITKTSEEDDMPPMELYETIYTVSDAIVKGESTGPPAKYYYDRGANGVTRDEGPLATKDFVNRQNWVDTTFAQHLDDLLATVDVWPNFDPTNKNPVPMRAVYSYDTVGQGKSKAQWQFNHATVAKNNGPLTRVIIHSGTRVDGIECFYGGVSAGLNGARGGSPNDVSFDDGEGITGCKGYAGDAVDSLWFKLNYGNDKWFGGGASTAPNYGLDFGNPVPLVSLSDSTRLAYLYGWAGEDSIEELTFAWVKYTQ